MSLLVCSPPPPFLMARSRDSYQSPSTRRRGNPSGNAVKGSVRTPSTAEKTTAALFPSHWQGAVIKGAGPTVSPCLSRSPARSRSPALSLSPLSRSLSIPGAAPNLAHREKRRARSGNTVRRGGTGGLVIIHNVFSPQLRTQQVMWSK